LFVLIVFQQFLLPRPKNGSHAYDLREDLINWATKYGVWSESG